jgi:hypothetical protein
MCVADDRERANVALIARFARPAERANGSFPPHSAAKDKQINRLGTVSGLAPDAFWSYLDNQVAVDC